MFLVLLCNVNIAPLFAAEILVIESYHAEYPWDIGYKKALTEQFAGTHKLHFFEMDTKRLTKAVYQHRADLAWREYQRLQPDIVVLGDDNALKFLGPPLSKTQTPVVYLGIPLKLQYCCGKKYYRSTRTTINKAFSAHN